jgi:hypothetical protein
MTNGTGTSSGTTGAYANGTNDVTDAHYRAAEDGEVMQNTTDNSDGDLSQGMKNMVDGAADATRNVTNGVVNGAERITDGVIDGVDNAANSMNRNTTNTGR